MAGPPTKHGLLITFPDGREKHYLLNAHRVTIGRGKENAIVLPCETVSHYHCELRRKGLAFEIADVGSTNGTHLNEDQLKRDDVRELRNGDSLMIGTDVKARFILMEDISDSILEARKEKAAHQLDGSATVRLQGIPEPPPESAMNPVAAAVARAEKQVR